MPLITALANLNKRQAVTIVANPACYAVCNNAVGIFQSAGFNSTLCDVPGDFALAMLAVNSCTSKHSSDSGNVTRAYPALYTPLSYCESKNGFLESLTAYEATASAEAVADSISSIQASLESVTSSYCSLVAAGAPVTVLTYINCSQTTTGLTSAASTGAAASTLALSTLSTMTSTTTTSSAVTSVAASDSGLSKGAIAGVAVGSTIAGILMIVLVIGFIWWYRRKRRREISAAQERERLQNTPEKAQLHSDDYKPHREELRGSKATQQVRTIEGLHEVGYQDLSRVRSEMSANEVAAAELDRLGSSQIGTDSTLIDRSERSESRR